MIQNKSINLSSVNNVNVTVFIGIKWLKSTIFACKVEKNRKTVPEASDP